MTRVSFKSALPLLVSIEGDEKMERVTLTHHPKGFACEFAKSITPKLRQEIVAFLEHYLEGRSYPLPKMNWEQCTPFTRTVLEELMRIPGGKTRTYKEIAEIIHSPRGSRAIGGACGRNPFPLFIPCHRVLASSGGLGGFTGGISIKKALLAFEGV